ncbi:hypothetical protein MMC08_006515 [Hypocenomyce scalaris]|nr:hypothetical protein [Hypocenomyce scalaris]
MLRYAAGELRGFTKKGVAIKKFELQLTFSGRVQKTSNLARVLRGLSTKVKDMRVFVRWAQIDDGVQEGIRAEYEEEGGTFSMESWWGEDEEQWMEAFGKGFGYHYDVRPKCLDGFIGPLKKGTVKRGHVGEFVELPARLDRLN